MASQSAAAHMSAQLRLQFVTLMAIFTLFLLAHRQRVLCSLKSFGIFYALNHREFPAGILTRGFMAIMRHIDTIRLHPVFFSSIDMAELFFEEVDEQLKSVKLTILVSRFQRTYLRRCGHWRVSMIQRLLRGTFRGSRPWSAWFRPGAPAVPAITMAQPDHEPDFRGIPDKFRTIYASTIISLPPAATIIASGFAKEFDKVFDHFKAVYPESQQFSSSAAQRITPKHPACESDGTVMVERMDFREVDHAPIAYTSRKGLEMEFRHPMRQARALARIANEGARQPLRRATRFHEVKLWRLHETVNL